MQEAVISRIDIAAAHDGEAELVATLTHGNGGQSSVSLDEFAARTLFASANVTSADALIGVSWLHVRDALIASSSRFTQTAPLS
jgi:hypothetical protein